MGRNKKRLRKSVTESFLPKKIKVERDRQPTRFSKRIRNMAPSFTSYSEILRNPVKYIKTEKVVGEYGKPVLNQESNQFNVQVRGSTFKSKVSVKNQKFAAENVLTVSKAHPYHKPQMVHNRKKYVLEILNKGDQKEIEKLHSVGSKTAERILLFRQLKGTISKISELTLMPKFTKSKFNNFVQQNYLKTD